METQNKLLIAMIGALKKSRDGERGDEGGLRVSYRVDIEYYY